MPDSDNFHEEWCDSSIGMALQILTASFTKLYYDIRAVQSKKLAKKTKIKRTRALIIKMINNLETTQAFLEEIVKHEDSLSV